MKFKFGFGSWRFMLAFLVAISHLWSGMGGGFAAYSVWGFFVLSGFLMTEILRNKYGVTVRGVQNYAFNRCLRIYPLYYVALLLGCFSILVLPKFLVDPRFLNTEFYLPVNFSSWLADVTILPFPQVLGRPVSVSSALAVEIGAYFLMPIMALQKRSAWVFLAVTTVFNISSGLGAESFAARYTGFFTGLFAFSAGALVNHYKKSLLTVATPLPAVAVWLGHCILMLRTTWPWTYGLYVSVLLSGWVVISLYQVKSRGLDKLLGDLSYPLYLFHTIVGAWGMLIFGVERSMPFFLVSFTGTVLLSFLLLKYFDEPVQKVKRAPAGHVGGGKQKSEVPVSPRIRGLAGIVGIVVCTVSVVWVYYNVSASAKEVSVVTWGPQIARAGEIPNRQPDGSAGLWVEVKGSLGWKSVQVSVNGRPVQTVAGSNVVTALIPKEAFREPGNLTLTLSVGTTDMTIGTLLVR